MAVMNLDRTLLAGNAISLNLVGAPCNGLNAAFEASVRSYCLGWQDRSAQK